MATALFAVQTDAEPEPPDSLVPPDLSLVLPRPEAWSTRRALARLSAELDLARQNRRVLALVIFCVERQPVAAPVDSPAAGREGSHLGAPEEPALAGEPAQLSVLLASVLHDTTREMDAVTHAASRQWCLVAMPEASEMEAGLATRRLERVCANRLASPVRSGMAVFPRDGYTLEALIGHAERLARAAAMTQVLPAPQRRKPALTLLRRSATGARPSGGLASGA
jgi:hypothetical protein